MSFHASYLGLLERWPRGTQTREVAGVFGPSRVTEAGPADGPPLVLLHGGGSSSMIWFRLAGELAADFRVYAIDQPGDPGLSRPEPTPPRTVDDLVRWLDEVLDALALPRVSLCGHSSGAHLALSYTLAHPGRVSKLSLLDPTQCFTGLSPGYALRAAPLLLRPTRDRAARLLAWESGGSVVDPGWAELYAAGAEFQPRPRTIMTKQPARESISSLTMPVQVVVAGQSRVHDPAAVAEGARRLLRHGTVDRVGSAAHHSLLFANQLPGQIRDFVVRQA